MQALQPAHSSVIVFFFFLFKNSWKTSFVYCRFVSRWREGSGSNTLGRAPSPTVTTALVATLFCRLSLLRSTSPFHFQSLLFSLPLCPSLTLSLLRASQGKGCSKRLRRREEQPSSE